MYGVYVTPIWDGCVGVGVAHGDFEFLNMTRGNILQGCVTKIT